MRQPIVKHMDGYTVRKYPGCCVATVTHDESGKSWKVLSGGRPLKDETVKYFIYAAHRPAKVEQ